MSVIFDEKWLQDFKARGGKVRDEGRPTTITQEKEKRKSKYNAQMTETDGKRFDSRHEAKMYEEFRLRGLAGEYKALCLQAIFYLPGGIKYLADFVTLNNDGTYTVYDAKSEATRKDAKYRLKRRLMKEVLNVEIIEI